MIDNFDLPAFRLHQLKGCRESIYSIAVNGNWRVTFESKNGNAYIELSGLSLMTMHKPLHSGEFVQMVDAEPF